MYGAAVLVFIIVRIILAKRGDKAERPVVLKRSPSERVLAIVLRLLVGGVVVALALGIGSVELSLVAVPLLVPGAPIALAVWLGVPYVPYWLTRALRPWSAGRENRAAAVFWELRARVRRGVRLRAAEKEKLAELALGAAGVQTARSYTLAARAMIDALQGNAEQAKFLFNLALSFERSAGPARRYSHAWLLSEAAQRGAWGEVLYLGQRGPWTPRRALLVACAEQLLGLRPHPMWRLRLLWALTPGLVHNRALLAWCRAAPAAVVTPETTPGIAAAFEAAAQLLSAPPGSVTRDQITAVAGQWQRSLDEQELPSHLRARHEALSSPFDSEQVLSTLERGIIELLAAALAQSPPRTKEDATDVPPILLAAGDRLQDQLFSELERLTEDLESGDHARPAPLEHILRRWAEIRWLAQRYLERFPHGQTPFYDNFGTLLLNHGVWLHNEAAAYPLARDVFAWLAALVPPEHEDAPLLRSNEALAREAAQNQW